MVAAYYGPCCYAGAYYVCAACAGAVAQALRAARTKACWDFGYLGERLQIHQTQTRDPWEYTQQTDPLPPRDDHHKGCRNRNLWSWLGGGAVAVAVAVVAVVAAVAPVSGRLVAVAAVVVAAAAAAAVVAVAVGVVVVAFVGVAVVAVRSPCSFALVSLV